MPTTAASVPRMQAMSLEGMTEQPVLNCQPTPKGFLVHNRGQAGSWNVWDFNGKPVWLPSLIFVPLMPGAAGVRSAPKGSPLRAFSKQHEGFRLEGREILPAELVFPAEVMPDGVAGIAMKEAPCATGTVQGIRHHLAWDVPREALPGRAQQWRHDRERFNAARVWLIENLHLQPMHEIVRDDALERQRERVAAREKVVTVNADVRDRGISAARKRLEVMEAAIEVQPGGKLFDAWVKSISKRS